jgi:2-oxoglutarate dehydrogenase E2 component (dihydrolipoamide succinyltransferase)
MPAARREMEQRGVKPEEVEATGPGGRITKEDVTRQAKQTPPAERRTEDRPATERRPDTAQPTARPAPRPEPEPQTAAGTIPPGNREEDVVPMSPMRKRIAERLVQAQQNAALLTTFNEVDMSAVVALRQQHRDAFEKKYNVKLGFMSFFVKACVESLKQFPQINAEIRGTDIVYHNYFDIGIAVSGGKGLVVPVLRNAERMSFAQIESAIADFASRARDNKISLEELKGGTFTITNGGVFGSLLSTPIINPPQSGILGLHAMQDRPVAREGQVVIRPMMYIALTYDHRLVDGREAVTFLRRIKEIIEEPSRMLIEI